MAKITKIILQQMVAMDQSSITASRYPRYTVVLGNSISSITAGELTASVDAAAASAAAAKESEIAAKDSEINAKASEQEAAISEQNAETSAGQAADSATKSANSASESGVQAGEAKKQADLAKGSATAADVAAQNAEQSRLLAEQAKEAAAASAAASAASATEAGDHSINAGASANEAGEYAAAAKASELAAKESETNAAGSATTAGDKAVDATAEADRAKAEADRAMQVVDGKLDKNDISGFIKTYKTLEAAEADVANRVLGEKILVWSKTNSRYGWYKVAGTAEAPVLELESEESKLLSVNNVQPDEYGNVQVTLPGGNPSLWLGEVTWFPYDKDSGIGYSGVLPADGREVLRVDYPDTWEAIEAGLIPSVSEVEWQAGSKLYFSTGNGTTTFRLPDMMQGQAFRAADKNEDNAGAIQDQIPYVATVNNAAPDDNGNVSIKIKGEELTGIVPVAKGGTGADTADNGLINLNGFKFQRTAIASDIDLNTLDGNSPGAYYQPMSANATTAKNYPTQEAGSLVVYRTGANGNNACVQLYYPFLRDYWYLRTASPSANGQPLTWRAWVKQGGDKATRRADLDVDGIGTETEWTVISSPNKRYRFVLRNNGVAGFQDGVAGTPYALPVSAGGTGGITEAIARTNLSLDRFEQASAETRIFNGEKSAYLVLNNSNVWGAVASAGGWISLGIAQGGTGANNASDARTNLGLGSAQAPTFAHINLLTSGDAPQMAAGILNGFLRDSSGNQRTRYRIYSEIRGDNREWLTLHLQNSGSINKYAGLDIDGNMQISGDYKCRALDPVDAVLTRKNIEAFKQANSGIGNVSADSFLGDNPGVYYQPMSAYATPANRFPEQTAGTLVSVGNGANGAKGCTQFYYPFSGAGGMWFRRYFASSNSWEPGGINAGWRQFLTNNGGVVADAANTNPSKTGTDFNSLPVNAVSFGYGNATNNPKGLTGIVHSVSNHAFSAYRTQLFQSYSAPRLLFRAYNADSAQAWTPWAEVWTDRNTTVDANGFIKRASPVIQVYGDGNYQLNEESKGASVKRVSEGVYKISGVLSFNSEQPWEIEIPLDNNKQPLIWVDYEIEPDGDILLKTFHRTHPNSPAFARNIKEGYEDGQPMDIPAGRWVDLRVQMPGADKPEDDPTSNEFNITEEIPAVEDCTCHVI